MRKKNALRGHFIAPYTTLAAKPETADYKELAKWISNISKSPNDQTDDTGFYDGDGTNTTTVTGVAPSYEVTGNYDPEDEAQAMIADMEFEDGESRLVWHRIVSADLTKEWVGVATVSEIIAGSGDATAYEDFSCTISYNQKPERIDLP